MTLQETADFLATSGFPDAAAFLRDKGGVPITSHYLADLKKENGLALSDSLFQANPLCRIWSNEKLAWWRTDGAGYTEEEVDAGIYSFQHAWDRTSHCDVTKGIVYEVFERP